MSSELVTYQPRPTTPAPLTIDSAIQVGTIMAESGMFQDAKDVAKAVAKVIAGRELGIGPMAAMTGINIIQGKVTLSANLVAGLIKRSGRYDYRAVVDDAKAEIVFYEHGQEIGRASFSLDDAKRAKLAGDNWAKYPRDMMFARAITAGARRHTPDVFAGPVYVPEEMGAYTDPETGEVLEHLAPLPPPVPAPDLPALGGLVDFEERFRGIYRWADVKGIDLPGVWKAVGVSAQKDLEDDAIYAKARVAVGDLSGEVLVGEVVDEPKPEPENAQTELPSEMIAKRRRAPGDA